VEGKAKIYTKYIEKNQQNQLVENEVFYNPVQIFNRDFTILVMQAYIDMLKEESNFYY
jgi:tRNA G26 N,N-dimethylase Trm1